MCYRRLNENFDAFGSSLTSFYIIRSVLQPIVTKGQISYEKVPQVVTSIAVWKHYWLRFYHFIILLFAFL